MMICSTCRRLLKSPSQRKLFSQHVGKSSPETFLSFLQKNYLELNDEFVQPSRLITDFGRSMPLEGRENMISECKNLYDKRYRNKFVMDRNVHKIGVIGGCSGIGKTRCLVEIAEEVNKWKNDDEWYLPIIISYNNGNPPIIDLKLSKKYSASCSLALRIIYSVYIGGKLYNNKHVLFETFVKSIPKKLLVDLTPLQVVLDIVSYEATRRRSSQDKCVVFLAIDETNYLVPSKYRDASDGLTGLQFLKDTMIGLGSILMSTDPFVFAVVAGTMVQPLTKVFTSSGYPIQALPMTMLNIEQVENIVESMIPSLHGNWKNWRTCRTFRTMLADFGSLPRRAEQFLELVDEQMQNNVSLEDVDYVGIQGVLWNIRMLHDLSEDIMVQIVSDMLLQTPVDRYQKVIYGSDMTYGTLELIGHIALETRDNFTFTVGMTYADFRKRVRCLHLSSNSTIVKMLTKVCDITDSIHDDVPPWQLFEKFHSCYEPLREMLLYRNLKLDEASLCDPLTFYCVDKSIYHHYDMNKNLSNRFQLRRDCKVKEAPSKFPISSSNMKNSSCIGDAESNYMKTVSGDIFDGYTIRRRVEDSSKLFFCAQLKLHIFKSITTKDISTEYNKVKNAFSSVSEFYFIIIAPLLSMRDNFIVPSNCLMVSGESLKKFYSPMLYSRMNLFVSTDFTGNTVTNASCDVVQVNINTASKLELQSLPNIGKFKADKIIDARKDKRFESWIDLKNRIKGIPSNIETALVF